MQPQEPVHQLPYQQARSQGQDLVRQTVLQVASDLLSTEGPTALSMRRIAQLAGCSTMVLYHLFGSKDGLVDALYVEGFERLAQAVAAVAAQPDPRLTIVQLCQAYRQMARHHPTHYAVMFQQAIPDFQPSPASQVLAKQTMDPLRLAVQQAISSGLLQGDHADVVAMQLWAAAHGFVSLELAGYLPLEIPADHSYRLLIERLCGHEGV